MTLQVSFEQFTETVKRLLNQELAYIAPHHAGSLVTSAKPEKSIVVACLSRLAPEVATAALKERGMEVFEGSWLTPEEVLSPDTAPRQTYIAAVSYRSGGDKPGTWVD